MELISIRQFVLSVVVSEARKCMYLDETTGFRNCFSEPATAIQAYIERLKYLNNVILVTVFFKVSKMKLVRHEKSITDLCLKRYSFLCFSLD